MFLKNKRTVSYSKSLSYHRLFNAIVLNEIVHLDYSKILNPL